MTYTILALDAGRSALGVATASRSLAVGATVPAIAPGTGVAASQAWTNPGLRGRLLAALAAGEAPESAVTRVPSWDAASDRRQVAVLALDGRGAALTGSSTTPWRGQLVSDGIVVLGNLLTGAEVLTSMRDAFGAPDGVAALAEALTRALRAGEAAGGDARGRQSAALLAAEVGAEQTAYDLRVDDAADPVAALERLVRLRASSL